VSSDQIILYAVIGALVLLWALRTLRRRGIPRRSAAEVQALLAGTNATVLLDVRTDAERRGTVIKGSHHIPLHRLRSRAGELEKYRNREIVCYCQNGNRSLTAASVLRRLGYSASSMEGGIVEWNSAR
jgi:rhodanese-related sulfurtransferase